MNCRSGCGCRRTGNDRAHVPTRLPKVLTTLDYLILATYLAGVVILGVVVSGRQTSTVDYFLAGRNLPWWVACVSTVATETSTLTVIGLPAIAYGGSLAFMQLTLGYLLGRTVVAIVFLPRYYAGQLETTYEFLGQRYGDTMRATASLTFLVTRLLADGVRLFATAIPIKVIADSAGLELGYGEVVTILVGVTVVYTCFGGMRAVVWMDVVQLFVYVGAGVAVLVVLAGEVPAGWLAEAGRAGKTVWFDTGLGYDPVTWLTSPYLLPAAVIGGAVFSMASHGTDQLMVQRLLACRSLRDSQKALVGSALLVMVQFGLFLAVGLMLWSYYGGATPAELGLGRTDEIFPRYIIEGLPPGVRGLLLAGIIAAAMSTLSSSMNSLAASTVMDLYQRLRRGGAGPVPLLTSRIFTALWGLLLIGFAAPFQDMDNPVAELGLMVASFTYGGLLGVFLLGVLNRASEEADAIFAFSVTVVLMAVIVLGLRYGDQTGWTLLMPGTGTSLPDTRFDSIAWPWYPVIGAGLTLVTGALSVALRRVRS